MDIIHVSPLPLQDHSGGSLSIANRCIWSTSAGNIVYVLYYIVYCMSIVYTLCVLCVVYAMLSVYSTYCIYFIPHNFDHFIYI